jgi:cytoskeletal protein RodZ
MPSAGELLRSERTKRSRSLTEIADTTRISRRYLEAIEADHVQELPGEFFYKSFIRQYARALDLDADTTERILGSAVPLSEPDPVPALHQVYERASAGESVRWTPTTAVAVSVLIAVIFGGAGLYALWQHLQARPEAPVADSPAPGQTAPLSQTQQAQPAPPQPAPASAPTAPLPVVQPAAGQTMIELAATEPAWVQVSSEGKPVLTATVQPDAPRQVTIGSNGKLLTGNAGALEVKVNGTPVGPLGPRGHIRTVLFNGGNFQIVQPRPPIEE